MTRAISILAILAAFSLTACSSDEEAPPSPQDANYWLLTERQYVLDNGSTVTCITYRNGPAGGVTCDWGGVQ